MTTDKNNFDYADDKLLELLKSLKVNKGIWDAYRIQLNNSNTADAAAQSFYYEHFLLSAIMEAFLENKELNLKELNQFTWNKVPVSFVWKIPVSNYHAAIIKAIKLGYIVVSENGHDKQHAFTLSDTGFKILQEQTFQNLAATSFFSFHANEFNKRAYKTNRLAILIAVISLLVTFVSLVVAIIALT